MKKSLTYTKKHSEKRQIRRAALAESANYPEPPTPPPNRLIVEDFGLIRPGSPEEAFTIKFSNLFIRGIAWLREYSLEVTIALVVFSLLAFVATVVALNLIY